MVVFKHLEISGSIIHRRMHPVGAIWKYLEGWKTLVVVKEKGSHLC